MLFLRRSILPFLLLVAGPATADSFPPISDAERALTAVPDHPGAPAVVLFEKAVLRIKDFRQDLSSKLDVQVRLKILAEEGKEYGEVEIGHSRFHRLKDFAGRTVLPDGRVVPLPEDSIFVERTSRARKSFVTKAAFPAVEVGAILDYRYSVTWDSIYFLEPWYFHNQIPTLLSEIVYDKPDNMALQPWYRETSRQKLRTDSKKSGRGVELRVWMEDLPPVPDEVHGFPFSDLSARFMVVPTEIMLGGAKTQIFDSWETVCSNFEEYQNYGKARRKDRQAGKEAARLAAAATAGRGKAEAVYRFVRDEILTTSYAAVFLSEDSSADRVLAERQGTSAEKAVLLRAMLAGVGMKSKLVWAADRRDGQVDLAVPNPWWFDKVLVMVEVDGERVFLDPADRRLGFGRLSPYNEGTPALVFDRKNPEVITLPRRPFSDNVRRADLDLALDEDGRLTGTGTLQLTGHHAWRRLRWKDDAEAIAEAWQEWLADVFDGHEASDVAVEESLDDQQVRVTWTLAQREEEVLGDETSLKPSRPLGPIRQPFTLPARQRVTPVWLSFGDRDEVALTVTWPEGWEVDLAPGAVDHRGEVGAASVEVAEDGRRLTYKRRFDVNGCEFGGRDKYAALQSLYGAVEKSDAQDLVLVLR